MLFNRDMTTGGQTTCDKMWLLNMTKIGKHLSTNSRNVVFSQYRQIQRQESHRIRVEWHWDVGVNGVGYSRGTIMYRYSRPLLIANVHPQAPHSKELRIGPTEPLLINYDKLKLGHPSIYDRFV